MQVVYDIDNDEFNSYFNKTYEPKILITSCDNPHTRTIAFMKVFCFIILAFLSIKKRVNSFHCKALLRIWIPPTIDSAALKISPIYPLNVNNYLPMVDGQNSCQLMCKTNLRNYRYNIGLSSFTNEIFISLFLDIICRLSKIVHISRVFKSAPDLPVFP